MATNSGWKSGACVRLENMLHNKLFYFACRHQVNVMNHENNHKCCVEDSLWTKLMSNPDNLDFKNLKKLWDNFADKSSFNTLNIANRQLKQQKYIVVKFLVRYCPHLVKQQLIICLVTTIKNVLSRC